MLLNRYRDGRDGMGWHADDEPELGRIRRRIGVAGRRSPVQIAPPQVKARRYHAGPGHGSLLLMAGTTQHHYLHAVPKTTRVVGERINLTFRCVLPTQ